MNAASLWLPAISYRQGERLALRVSQALGLALPVCALLAALDPRMLDSGEPVWLKPMRFCLAFGVHLLTMTWIGRLSAAHRRQDTVFAAGLWLQAATVIVEMACVGLQAARGVHSHFNYATPFDHAVFTIMGIGTALTLLGLLLCAWGVLRSTEDRFTRGLLLGAMALAILGGLIGVVMVMPTAEQKAMLDAGSRLAWIGGVGVGNPSGRELPFFTWDLSSGDWRAAHFAGLHALQTLPVLAWLATRADPVTRSAARRWAVAGALAYAGLVLAVVAWTASGRSVLAAAQPGWWILGLPMATFALCALALTWPRGPRCVG